MYVIQSFIYFHINNCVGYKDKDIFLALICRGDKVNLVHENE